MPLPAFGKRCSLDAQLAGLQICQDRFYRALDAIAVAQALVTQARTDLDRQRGGDVSG